MLNKADIAEGTVVEIPNFDTNVTKTSGKKVIMVGLLLGWIQEQRKGRGSRCLGRNKNWKMERREDKRVWSCLIDHKNAFINTFLCLRL